MKHMPAVLIRTAFNYKTESLSPMALVHGKMLLMKLSLVLLEAATTWLAAAADPPPPDLAKPDCLTQCGNLIIPYPFGVGENCYLPLKQGQEEPFRLTCDNATDPPLKLSSNGVNITVSGFNITAGELEVMNFIYKDNYSEDGANVEKTRETFRWNPPFSISGPRNRFVAVGCDTSAVLRGFRDEEVFMTGCMSVCLDIDPSGKDSCSGVGCCQTKIPEGLTNSTVILNSYYNHVDIWKFNPCSYAFVVKHGFFNFSGKSTFKDLKKVEKMPMILNWQIGNEPCKVAVKNKVDFACKENSTCHNRVEGPYPGYYCSCTEGYEGNPYIGCRDIDECSTEIKTCQNGACHNLPGNYSCKCNSGFKNNGPQICIPKPATNNTPLKISLGICIGFLVLLVVIFGVYRQEKRNQFNKLAKKFFEENSGPKLLLRLATQKLAVFSRKDIEKATDNFSEDKKIGEGGYGIVYKGELDDKRVVAIKMSKGNARVKGDQIIEEVVVISGINHRNVVRLLGCCFETETPMLVYEYVGNGTLYDRIHKRKEEPFSFAQRLRIAAETATALAYLHHSTIPQIVHREVNTRNILLDEELGAKVSDFGVLKLVPEKPPTLVQGKTEKIDVYSFGVVLVELLTRKNADSLDKREENNLANVFVSTFENEGTLGSILDQEIVTDANREIIKKVAKLAVRCLREKEDERPTMKEVEGELHDLLKTLKTLENQAERKKPHASPSKEIDHSIS